MPTTINQVEYITTTSNNATTYQINDNNAVQQDDIKNIVFKNNEIIKKDANKTISTVEFDKDSSFSVSEKGEVIASRVTIKNGENESNVIT
jgi:hypothetical protein